MTDLEKLKKSLADDCKQIVINDILEAVNKYKNYIDTYKLYDIPVCTVYRDLKRISGKNFYTECYITISDIFCCRMVYTLLDTEYIIYIFNVDNFSRHNLIENPINWKEIEKSFNLFYKYNFSDSTEV